MPSIRIVLADDHPLIRKGLRQTLEGDEHLNVVGEADDGAAALETVRKLKPDIAILDIDMPKMDGFQIAREVIRLKLPTRVIFLTLHADEAMLRDAMAIGGKGYVLKESAVQEIIAAIYSVLQDSFYVSAAMTSRLLQPTALKQERTSVLEVLTPAERKILRLVSDGLTSKEIGDALSIHYRTVENHRTNMCRKLKIDGASALLRFALNHRQLLDTMD